LDRLADGLVGQSPWGQLLLERHVGQQVQRPSASGLAEASRGLVEDARERVGLRPVEDGLRVFGSVFLLGQAADSLTGERADGVVDGSDRAANPPGDLGGSLAFGTGQEDLGTPQRERLATTKSGLELSTLRTGQLPNEEGWFHDPLFGSAHRLTRNRMQLH